MKLKNHNINILKTVTVILLAITVLSANGQQTAKSNQKITPFSAFYTQHIIANSLNTAENGGVAEPDVKEAIRLSVTSKYIADSLSIEMHEYDSYGQWIKTSVLRSDGKYSLWEGDNQSPLLICYDQNRNINGVLLIKNKLMSIIKNNSISFSFTLTLSYNKPIATENVYCEAELSFNGKDFFPLDRIISLKDILNKNYAYQVTENDSQKFSRELKKQNADISAKGIVYYRFIFSDRTNTKVATPIQQSNLTTRLKNSTHVYVEGEYPATTEITKPANKPTVQTNSIQPVKKPADYDVSMVQLMQKRQNVNMGVLEVSDPLVEVKIYDNGIIDDDTVSVFCDGKLVIPRKKLTTEPIVYTIQVNTVNGGNNLILFANNLGSIPPNTAIMIITNGAKRFTLYPKMDLNQNNILQINYNPALKNGAILKE